MTLRVGLILAVPTLLLACSGSSDGPPPASETVASRLAAGTAALEGALGSGSTDQYLSAAEEFTAAAALVATDGTATAADKDRARFFGALARLGVLMQPYSDGTNDGLNDLGDVLDAFGLLQDRADRATMDPGRLRTCSYVYGPPISYQCETPPFSPDSPRSGELQGFAATRVADALRAAVALLDAVSPTFSATVHDGGKVVEIDATDALFLKALAHGALALIEVQQAYNLDVDIDALRASLEGATPYALSDFAAQNPDFLRLLSAATLPASRADAIALIEGLQAAVASLEAETDDQADDLIAVAERQCSYDPITYSYSCSTTYNPAQTLDAFASDLSTALAVVTATGPYTFQADVLDPADDVVVYPSRFFAGLDLRALAPSTFTAGLNGDRPGPFPDATFGGLLVSAPFDVNADLDADGSPDILGGYTCFGPWLQGRSMGTWTYVNGTYRNETYAFAATTSTFTWTDTSVGGATSTGTYAYALNVLTLTFDAEVSGVKTVVISSDDLSDAYVFSAQVTYRDALGNVLLTTYQTFYLS